MKRLIVFAVLALVGCGKHADIPTYEQLVKFRKSCTNSVAELKELHIIQDAKNFAQDPDELSEEDRAYNSRLKATIWWYTLECGNAKNTNPIVPN